MRGVMQGGEGWGMREGATGAGIDDGGKRSVWSGGEGWGMRGSGRWGMWVVWEGAADAGGG